MYSSVIFVLLWFSFDVMCTSHLLSLWTLLRNPISYQKEERRWNRTKNMDWNGIGKEKLFRWVYWQYNLQFFYFYTFHPCLRQKKKQPAERKMYRLCDWNKNFIFYCRHYYYYYYYIGVPPTKKELYITYIPLRCLCKMQ